MKITNIMKRRPLLLCVWLVLMLVATQPNIGCKASSSAGTGTQNAPSLPEGAANAFDATSYRTVYDAHAAIAALQSHVASKNITLTDAQKAILNKIIADQNAAQQLWKAYHAVPTGDTAALQTAIQGLVGDIAQIAQIAQSVGGK